MFKTIPPVTRNLLFINIIVFLIQMVVNDPQNHSVTDLFGLLYYRAPNFHFWQPFTYMFLHGSWMHIMLNMLSLWMFGRIIETSMGGRRFLVYYVVCGMGAALCQELWQTAQYMIEGLYQYDGVNLGGGNFISMAEYLNTWKTIGASGAVYGVLLAFGMTYPEERIMMLFPPIPMKAKYFVIVYAVIEVFSAYASNDNVAHFAHLGGMFFGWLLIRQWRKQARQQRYGNDWRATAGRRNGQQDHGLLASIRRAVMRWGAALENLVRPLFEPKSQHDKYRSNYGKNNSRSYQNPDHAYNAEKRAQQARIDAILDKVRRSGYASLSEDEKRELFDNSRR